jgi:hypothetical protein
MNCDDIVRRLYSRLILLTVVESAEMNVLIAVNYFFGEFSSLGNKLFWKKLKIFFFIVWIQQKKNAEWLSFPALLRVKWCQEFHIGTYCISYLHVLKIGFHGQYRIGAIYQNLARNILVWGEYVKQVLKCAIRQRISYPICLCNMYMTYI